MVNGRQDYKHCCVVAYIFKDVADPPPADLGVNLLMVLHQLTQLLAMLLGQLTLLLLEWSDNNVDVVMLNFPELDPPFLLWHAESCTC